MYTAVVMKAKRYFLSEGLSRRSLRLLDIILLGGAAIAAAWYLYFAACTLLSPYPLEFREGVAQVLTGLLLSGRNPFSLQNQPLGMTNYGVVYNLVALPLAALFGNTLIVHRAITLFFILVSAYLVLRMTARLGRHKAFALLCAVLVAIGLAGRGGLGAFPSGMGSALFLLAMVVPFSRTFDYRGLLLSAVLCVIAFFTKPYYVLSFGIVASYLLLFASKRKAVAYAFAFIFIFGAAYAVMRISSNLYFVDTLVGNWSNGVGNVSFPHASDQLQEGLREYYPMLILGTVLLALQGRSNPTAPNATQVSPATSNSLLDIRNLDLPLVSKDPGFWAHASVVTFLAFLFILGPHRGAYMTYLYQTLPAPVLIWLSSRVVSKSRLVMLSMPLLMLNAFMLAQTLMSPDLLSHAPSLAWDHLYTYVDASGRTLNSPVVTSRMMENGILPTDSGQTEYYYLIRPYPSNLLLGPDYRIIQQRGAEYNESIRQAIASRDYDLVMLTEERPFQYMNLLVRKYHQVDRITVSMPQSSQDWTVDVWKPISKNP